MLDLIYCAGNNRPFMDAALEAGWLLGVRSDRTSYGYQLALVDIEYRRPNWERHLRRVALERPRYAIVPDLSEMEVSADDVARALAQADHLAEHCAVPLLVPKLAGQLALIPERYAIAYSIPSTYGGARFGPWQLAGRRVHLLGGSPATQLRIYRSLVDIAEVMSADGNMAQKVAVQKLNYVEAGVWKKAPRGTPYLECWVRSCRNIVAMWHRALGVETVAAEGLWIA